MANQTAVQPRYRENRLQNKLHYLLIALALLAGVLHAAAQGPAAFTDLTTNMAPLPLTSRVGREDPEGRGLLQEAQRIIAAYHEAQPRAKGALRVIYFVPK